MALGTVTGDSNIKKTIMLLAAATAVNSPPADAADSTVGIAAYGTTSAQLYAVDDSAAFYLCKAPDITTLTIHSTAGSATMTGTFVLWCYLRTTGKWYPKTVNGAAGASVAIAETAADKIRYIENYTGLGAFDRFYLEIAVIGGTSTAFEAHLTTVYSQGA